MMLPVTLGLLCALILHTAAGDCQGEKPTKQLFCYLDNLPAQFDPCLCTHLILQTPVDKLTPQSELLVSARRLQEKNPALRLVLQAAESAELALKRRGGYAQTVAAAVAKCDLDGVEVALAWGKQVAAKVQLVDFVQTLSKELDKISPKDRTKRSYEIHENIEGDVVTPRWTPEANRRIHSRKTREAESSKETSTETVEKESLQEIEEEEELPENGKQIIVHLTSQPQHLAKNFDLKRLSKYVSFYTLASDNLTDSSESGLAYHPSRLMGIEDILNADSLVDLVTGLGAPHEKLVLTLPATALRFTLADRDHNMPQSKVQGTPVKITRAEMCKLMSEGEWTVERDEDLTAPYAYHDTTWLAFDDLTSVSIKGKYVLLRDLAGAAVRAADTEDWSRKCETSGPVLLKTLHDTFTHVARQSRAAQLVSLQEQLHSAGQFSYSGDVHLSPYRIVRVVDRAGSIHVVRKEAKTEFECSRQGYFRHPSGCNRFYRCVKFNQYTPDFTVFEYDCPAGLAFDETVEVCVWPGSLADGGACQGSSEIAPVPRSRYVCPQGAGYYADPENCRWFFACLDHQGDGSPLTAYEFRCPFGLVFDEQALVCNWPWLVPGCGGSGVYSARFTVGDFYEGRHRPSYASLSDVHVSGGRIENVPGGVVLGSSVAGIGSGAYLGSVASGSNVFGSEINTKSGYPGSANLLGGYVSGSGSGANAAGYSAGSGSTYGAGSALGSGSVYNTGYGAYVAGSGSAGVGSGKYSSSYSGAGGAYSGGAGGAYSGGAHSGGASGAYSEGAGGAYNGGAGGAYSGGDGGVYSEGAGGAHSGGAGGAYSGGAGISSTRYGSYGNGAYASGGDYLSGNVGDYSGAYVEDNSGAYIHDNSGDYRGDLSGLYTGKESYGGQYKGGYVAGGAYVPGVYDNGAYSGSSSSGGQYKGSHVGGGAYSGSYDTGAYQGSGSTGGQYKGGYDTGSYSGKYDSGAYAGKYDAGAYAGKYDAGAYAGKYDAGAYAGKYDAGAYAGKYNAGAYAGKYDAAAYAGNYDAGAYDGKYDAGAYAGNYDAGTYAGKYDAGAYAGKYDAGAYAGNYDSGAYVGKYDSGAYRGSSDTGAHSGSSSYQGGYKVQSVPAAVFTDGGYGSHEYNSVDVGHKPVVGLVGLGAVKLSGGAAHSGGYVSSYVTPSPLPAVSVTPVAPVVSSYSTVTPAPVPVSTYTVSTLQPSTPRPLTYYPVPSSPVTPVTSRPLISYSTVNPPAFVQSYQQPSYVKTVTPAPAVYSTPTVGFVKTPVVPLRPVSYGYKQNVVNTGYVSSGIQYSTPAPVSSIGFEQPSYVKTVTPAPYYEKAAVGYSYQKPIPPAYQAPLPSYSYEYQPPATFVKPVEVKYSFPQPAVLKTPIVPLNPIQYSTPAPVTYSVSPVKPVSYAVPVYPTASPLPPVKVSYAPTVFKTPVVPLNPVQYSTPAPIHFEYSTRAPVKTVSYSTYSTPAPPVVYQSPAPLRPLRPITYTTPAPPVSVQYSTPRPVQPVRPLRPVSYSTPAPFAVQYNVPTVLKTPVVPLNPVQYSTPTPINFAYSTPTPPRPVNFVQPFTYSTPAPAVGYEYSPPAPVQPVSYVKPLKQVTYTYPTPAPAVTYEYSAPVVKPVIPLVNKAPVVPLNPIQYTTPAPPRFEVGYSTPVHPVAPAVTYQYSTPAPRPVRPVAYPTPAPAVSYEYSAPIQPVSYAKPLKPVTYSTYSTAAPAVHYPAPVVTPTVLKTPVIPLNPIQYTTSAPVHFEYSTPAPVPVRHLRPITYTTPAPAVNYEYLPPAPVQPVRPLRPITYTTPAPAVSYEYSPPAPVRPLKPLRPITYTTPAPAVTYEFSAPVVPTVLKTPVVPLNPIQYTTPAPVHFEFSTPAPVPVRPLRPITYTTPAPAISYEYSPPAPVRPLRPLRPISYTTPAPAVTYEYLPPAPIQPVKPLRPITYTTPAPAVSYEYLPPAPVQPVRPLRPISYTTPATAINFKYTSPVVKHVVPTVVKTPVVPLNPIQYTTPAPVHFEYSTPAPVRHVTYTTAAPAASYVPVQPVQPLRPITLSSPSPFSYDFKYQPVKQVPAVLKTPVVPLNPIQYTTPAPAIFQYSTPAPIQTVRYNKPVGPVTYTPSAPTVSYEYSTASPPETYGYKTSSYVKPVPTVLKTPVVPLNPVQYSTSSPIINQYRFGVAYQNPEIQYQPDVYYKQPAYVKTQVVQEGYDYPRPSVKFVEGPRVVSTTPAPTVTYAQEPVTPIYKQVYNYVKAPMVSAYEKVLNAISYSTTPAPLPVQPVTKSPVSYAPVTVGPSYNRPALVKTPSIPLTPVAVVPEYQKVLNVVKATTTSSPLYVNHYTNTYEQELVPVSTPRPVVYKQRPVVLTETTYTDTYDENVEDVYDSIKSDFGTRLTGGYEGGYVYNQQKVEVPQINVYTSTSAPAPVIKETYKVRRPITTYTQTYQQPAVAVGYEEGSYEEGSFYSSTPAPAIVSSSESGFGEQYHKETSFAGYTGLEGDVVSYEEVAQPLPVVTSTTQAPTVKITTARVSLPVVTPRPEGGYYVRKQKVRVRPVVTTENYPDVYSSTYPSTVSTTTFAPIYSTTPASPVTFSTTGHPEDEVDVEGEEEEEDGVKLLEGYDGQYGGVVSKGGYSVSSTVASIEDGEAIVGVLKKGRVTFDGRRTKTRVVVVSKLSDFNPLLVGKLGAECSCDGRSNSVAIRRSKQRGSGRLFTPSRDSTIPDQQYVDTYLTSTSTVAPIVVNSESSSYESSAYESSSYDSPVVEIRPLRKKTRFYSTTTSAPEYASTISEEPNFLPAGNDRVKVDSVQCKRAGLFRHPNKCNKFYSCNWDQWKKKFTLHEFKCPIHLAYDINLGACNWPSKGPACSDDNLLV